MSKKIVGVIFGGKSGEHEVSLVSAASVIRELPRDKYTVKEIGISVDGVWYAGEGTLENFKGGRFDLMEPCGFEKALSGCDIVFPVLHGPYGEDGTIQGLFEMMNIPYVGAGVMASSLCMDKIITKSVLKNAGISVVPWVGFTRHEWNENPSRIIDAITREIDFPCFVKPSNMGSSVGITKVKSLDGDSNAARNANLGLKEAIDLACEFDSRILVEKGINAREIECAVFGNNTPEAGELGEVIVGGEFYDFHDKYVDGKSSTEIPVSGLDPAKMIEIKETCLAAYREIGLFGLARVDCFVDRHNGEVYLNEINTMPGFTSISMFPKMWAAAGVPYPELLDRLVELGFERFNEKSGNKIKFESGSDWYK